MLIRKKQMNLSNFMQFILLFSLFFIPLSADDEKLRDLSKRLSLHPPTEEDYVPLLDTINNQLEAIKFHEFDRAYFFYASKDFKAKTSYRQFNLFIQANPVLLNNKSLATTEVHIDKNIGYYKGIITSKSDDVKIIHYELIYEDDTWKVLGIQIY